jgi:hypothetical protein
MFFLHRTLIYILIIIDFSNKLFLFYLFLRIPKFPDIEKTAMYGMRFSTQR